MQEKEISQAVIRRMPRYYRYLGELLEDGVEQKNECHCFADPSGPE